MQGRIIKGVGGSFIVRTDEQDFVCRAKGSLRYQKVRPLIGDMVEITPLENEENTANIVEILPRKNELIRPLVSNIDQAVIEFAAKDPMPSTYLLDKFLVQMKYQNVPVIICINKIDLVNMNEAKDFAGIYEKIGYTVLYVSAQTHEGLEALKSVIAGKTTVWAGPSGVGKSSIINLLAPEEKMETGALSEKIKRGKNTTRHVQLLDCGKTGEPGTSTYVCDTPGFSSIDLPPIAPKELEDYFEEFAEFIPGCRFRGCAHIGEWECGVKTAVRDGKISKNRYEDYKLFYEELKNRIRY